MVRGLVGAGHRHRLVAGPDAGVERGVEVVGQPGVPGQLGGGAAAHALAERLGVLGVQPHPLARQQVVVDGFAEEGVPEGVPAVAGDQQVHLDRLPQPLLELDGREPGRRDEQVVGDLAAGDAGHPDHLPGGLVEPVQADQQHVGEIVGDPAAGLGGRTDQLLDEERVALGAAHDRAQLLLADRARREAGDEQPDLVVAERAQLEPLDAAQPRPLGDLATERVAAVQVVGAVRRHDRHLPLEGTGEQEAEQVAGRLVGPVAVLDDQQHRGHRGGLLQQGVHRGEQVGPVEHLALDPGRRRRAPSVAASTRRPGWSRASDWCAAATRSTTSGSSAWSRPSTSENGRYGSALSPKSRQCPATTRHPSSTARSRSSTSSRVLPTPASPDSTTCAGSGDRVPRHRAQTTGRRATKQSPSARRLGRSGSGWSCVRPHRP